MSANLGALYAFGAVLMGLFIVVYSIWIIDRFLLSKSNHVTSTDDEHLAKLEHEVLSEEFLEWAREMDALNHPDSCKVCYSGRTEMTPTIARAAGYFKTAAVLSPNEARQIKEVYDELTTILADDKPIKTVYNPKTHKIEHWNHQ